MPASPDEPRDLKLEQSLSGLRYTTTTWERFRLHIAVLFLGPYGIPILVTFLSWLLQGVLSPAAQEVMETILLSLWALAMLQPPLFLVGLLLLRGRAQAQVSIDQHGMTLERQRQPSERVLWAACDGVRRRGRLVEVGIRGRWLPLPSPKTYPDAMWLEEVVRQNINARADDAIAPPEEVARALRALTGRVSS